jgi:uncharacterized protein
VERMGILEAIYRYPVKSMRGEEIAEASIGQSGMTGDRVYAFARSDQSQGLRWYTGRDHEALLLFRPRFRQGSASDVDVTTPDGRTLPIRSSELAAELTRRGGYAVTLHASERGIPDAYPISLLGNASAKALGDELHLSIDRRRFRANFYVDWIDDLPYRENDLVGRRLQVGEGVTIAIVERDPRCKMITIDPETAETERRILQHVKNAHSGMAGVYATVTAEGIVRRGDPIYLV